MYNNQVTTLVKSRRWAGKCSYEDSLQTQKGLLWSYAECTRLVNAALRGWTVSNSWLSESDNLECIGNVPLGMLNETEVKSSDVCL